MLVLLHVIIALTSVVLAIFAHIAPSQLRLRLAAALLVSTILSGSYLVITMHTGMLSACTMGLFYTSGMLAALLSSRHKLALQAAINKAD